MLNGNTQTNAKISGAEGEYMVPSTVNEGALNSQAGLDSLMLEDKPNGDTYYDVIGESQEVGYSPTNYGTNEALHAEEKERMIDALPSVLLDESVSDQEKEEVFSKVVNDENEELTTSYQYSRQTAETPEPIINSEYVDQKSAVLGALKQFDDYNIAVEAAYDQTEMSKDQSLVDSITDFATLMIPFAEQSIVVQMQEAIGKGDAESLVDSFLLMGEGKKDFIDSFLKMPIKERTQAVQLFANIIDRANTNIGMTNRMNGQQFFDAMVYGDYTDVERYMDDAVSVLDSTIILKPIAWAAQGIRDASRVAKVKNGVRASSANRAVQATNATEARTQVKDIIDDVTGEISQALTGTTREEAIADNVMPEPVIGGKGLRAKVGRPLATAEKADITNPQLRQVVDEMNIGVLTRKEVEAANSKVVNRLQEAKGITSRDNSFQVEAHETGARIKGTYGPSEGGWTNAQEAVDLVEVALRPEGITKDKLKVLELNRDGEYVQADGIPSGDGNYLVSIDHDYEVSFGDVLGDMEKFGATWNLLDRVPMFASGDASISRYFLDPASLLDRHLIRGANGSVDRAAYATSILLEQSKGFSDSLRGLSKEGRAGVMSYIKEANEKGMQFRPNQLKNDYGMSDSQINTIQKFRDFWDDEWAVNNRVEATSMRNEGYFVLEDTASDTRIYGRPRAKNNLNKERMVFNPQTEDLVPINSLDLDKLYEDGGQILQMRKPMDYDGVVTDYVLQDVGSNARLVRNNDVVRPYRDGYYRVSYDAPHFITKTVKMGDKEFEKAIATAETIEDAQLYLKRLQKTDPAGVYAYRGDVKDQATRVGFEQDTYETYGKGSQRSRGERLEDATAVVQNTEQQNVKGPVDAMVSTSRALGNKIGMSAYLDGTKQRFMEEFKDLLPKENGIPRFPKTVKELGSGWSKRTADARTQYEYISYLEHGYINGLDEGWKGLMRAAAEAVGEKGLGRTEKALRKAGEFGPTEVSKAAAFHTYIGLNPIRAFLMNAHQSSLLVANFPGYVMNIKGLSGDVTAFSAMAAGFKNTKILAPLTTRSPAELKLMYEEFLKSGLPSGIDMNNFARGSLTQFAENARIGSSAFTRAVGGALSIPRKIGFDAGEWTSLATAWLAHYDKAAKGGKKLNKTDFFNVAADSRNYTMNMGRAGDMPYNQKWGAMLFQFFQVPHKALLQMTTNQSLTRAEKARLFGYSAVAFGLPSSAIYEWMGSELPDRDEDPILHDLIVQGIEGTLLNYAISAIADQDVSVDFSSLSASDPSGIFEFAHNMATTEVGEVFANSPAGSLVAGDNARMKQFAHTVGRWFHWVDDDPNNPVSTIDVAKDALQLTSGFSNGYRAWMAVETGKKINGKGVVVDPEVSSAEGWLQLAGFPTMDETRSRVASNKTYEMSQDMKKDVRNAMNIITTQLAREGLTNEEYEYNSRIAAYMLHRFKDIPAAQAMIKSELERNTDKSSYIYKASMKMRGMMTPDEWRSFVQNLPDNPQNTRQQLLEWDKELRKAYND